MRPPRDMRSIGAAGSARPASQAPRTQAPRTQAPSSRDLLEWYRERDGDPGDLHRRYVRAKYGMRGWSEADLARFHRYRRSVSRERAAQLVIARRYAVRGMTIAAIAAAVAGLIYAAFAWLARKKDRPALPAGKTNTPNATNKSTTNKSVTSKAKEEARS